MVNITTSLYDPMLDLQIVATKVFIDYASEIYPFATRNTPVKYITLCLVSRKPFFKIFLENLKKVSLRLIRS